VIWPLSTPATLAAIATGFVLGRLVRGAYRMRRAGRLSITATFDRSDWCLGFTWYRRHFCGVRTDKGLVHFDALIFHVWPVPMCRATVSFSDEPKPIGPSNGQTAKIIPIGPIPPTWMPHFKFSLGQPFQPSKPQSEPGAN